MPFNFLESTNCDRLSPFARSLHSLRSVSTPSYFLLCFSWSKDWAGWTMKTKRKGKASNFYFFLFYGRPHTKYKKIKGTYGAAIELKKNEITGRFALHFPATRQYIKNKEKKLGGWHRKCKRKRTATL